MEYKNNQKIALKLDSISLVFGFYFHSKEEKKNSIK